MDEDRKLAADESRRTAQHEAIKGEVRSKVHDEIAHKAEVVTPREEAKADVLAQSLKTKAVREVFQTEEELERGQAVAQISHVVDYAFYLIYGLIGLEILLEALGAREQAGFKRLIDGATAPLLTPFEGLMPDPDIGPFTFRISYVFALIVYVLLHKAVNGLLRLFVHRKTAV